MLKRYRSSVELLPHDVVELILERLPVKSLLRFKSVSKRWKSTVETQPFQEKQLIRRKQSRGPDLLFISLGDQGLNRRPTRFVYGSSIAYTDWFPTLCRSVCYGSCDGLVCLYDRSFGVVVANPASRWHQSFPLAKIQQLLFRWSRRGFALSSIPKLGFGKDKHIGAYKPVFLYNSFEFGLDNITTCEVLDVSTNAWRYIHPASPYRINTNHNPVYLDGSLYWLTEYDQESICKVLSFDLHTEIFQVICNAPIPHVSFASCMGILDNNLCVSNNNWYIIEIWSLDASDGTIKAWRKLHSIDLTKTLDWLRVAYLPIQILDKTKSKLLLGSHESKQPMMIYDIYAKSYELLLRPAKPVGCYFESLFSALSN